MAWTKRPPGDESAGGSPERVALPPPRLDGAVSVEAALAARRSVRDYAAAPLTLAEVSQLLWAAQGRSGSSGYRTAPSAGALYPLEVLLVAGRIESLEAGLYRYRPAPHHLVRWKTGDQRASLARAALCQECVGRAPAAFAITAVLQRTAGKYGARAPRYVDLEAGCVAQNLHLQAAALGLGAVIVGAFDDVAVEAVLGLGEEQPVAIMPVGRITRRSR